MVCSVKVKGDRGINLGVVKSMYQNHKNMFLAKCMDIRRMFQIHLYCITSQFTQLQAVVQWTQQNVKECVGS